MTPESATPSYNRTGRLTLVFLVAVALGVTVLGRIGGPAPRFEGPMVSQPAPEVTIDLFAGGDWRLSEHLATDGRPVLLNLWASWCLPCEEEIPVLSQFALAHPEVLVVGAAVRDETAAAREMADRLRPAYPVGIDSTGRLRDRYVGLGMPALFLIDRDGMVVAQIEGGVDLDDLDTLLDLLEG